MQFANQLGLLALLSIIPFILLYLRKPKPIEKIIPSLMFLVKDKKVSKRFSFFRKFIHNLLFFIQLLSLIGLGIAVAEPFTKIKYDSAMENTVIIIDGSASMQTRDGLISRFEKAKKEAKSYLSGKVSIILAEDFPIVLLEDENADNAQTILAKLTAKSTGSNLGDAMLQAKEILKGRAGKVIVLSDFANSNGPDIFATKRVLTASKIDVVFVSISNSARNIGFTSLKLDKNNAQVFIKNFNTKEEKTRIKVIQDGKVISTSDEMTILPRSVEAFVFSTPQGITKLEIDKEDDFDADNVIYLSVPYRKKIKTLLVTDVKKSSIEDALTSSEDVEIEKKYFTPDRTGLSSYDIVILSQFQYVPGTFYDLSAYAKSGGNVIVAAQDNMNSIDFADIPLVKFDKVIETPSTVCASVINQFTKQFDKEKCFARTSKYFKAEQVPDTAVIASADGSPIFVLREKDNGKVFYYGLFDDSSDFKTLPTFPIFWNSLINFLVKSEDINDFNIRTGKIIQITEQAVKTPSGSITTDAIVIDDIGIYEFNSRKYAANLLDEKESDVSSGKDFEKENSKFLVTVDKKEKELYLSLFLMIAVSLLLAFEIFYLKRRGDV